MITDTKTDLERDGGKEREISAPDIRSSLTNETFGEWPH